MRIAQRRDISFRWDDIVRANPLAFTYYIDVYQLRGFLHSLHVDLGFFPIVWEKGNVHPRAIKLSANQFIYLAIYIRNIANSTRVCLNHCFTS